MDEHPAIRPNSKFHNKSRWASEAIVWFFDSPTLAKERDPETGDFTGKYVVGNVGQPMPIELLMRIEQLEKDLAYAGDDELLLRIEQLEKELEDLRGSGDIAQSEANRTPPRGVWSIISRILGRFS